MLPLFLTPRTSRADALWIADEPEPEPEPEPSPLNLHPNPSPNPTQRGRTGELLLGDLIVSVDSTRLCGR
eukprot:scaffold67112_cov57-Phaeocystis_antarctica.AAC.2